MNLQRQTCSNEKYFKSRTINKNPINQSPNTQITLEEKNGMGKRVKSIDGDAREEQEVHDPGLVELASSCSLENSF